MTQLQKSKFHCHEVTAKRRGPGATASNTAVDPGGTANGGNPVRRVCFTLQVAPDKLDEYRQRHAAVWPDMLTALRDAGWRDYSLFLGDDGLLVGYFLTDDLDAALAGMAATEVNERWQRDMAPFFVNGGRADAGMRFLDEVFNLETQLEKIGESS